MGNLPNLPVDHLLTCHFKASLYVGTIISNICLMVMKIHFSLVSCCFTKLVQRLDPDGLACIMLPWGQLSKGDVREGGHHPFPCGI